MADRHSSIREGLIAGVLGATTIAVWFLIIDVIGAHPFHTPDLLGSGLISILGKPPAMPDTMATHVIAYTIFHYIAFAIVGIVVASIVHQSARTPGILAGFLVLFAMFELGAYMLAGLFTESALGGMAWYQIFIANLVAAAAMGWYMYMRHPDLKRDLNTALAGEDA
ncbi:MAG TPA: hypothetical protein VM099_10105 [Gemmatimonadaceae bacterium]|nr:hypothetical protein [Gemmatimonadaceae bacterium]